MEDQSNYRSDGENAPEFNMPKQVQHNNDEPIKRMDAHQYEKTIQDLLEKIDILEARLKLMGEQKIKVVSKLKSFEDENEMLKDQISRQNESNKKLDFDRTKFEKQIEELQTSNKVLNEKVKAKFEILSKEQQIYYKEIDMMLH